MGLLDRLLKREDDSPIEFAAEDVTVRRNQLGELASSLDALVSGLRETPGALANPGVSGRMRDFSRAAADAHQLGQRGAFTRDDLYELLVTLRPLFPAEPPAHFSHLAAQNERVKVAIAALYE